jgi:hypothetical protein
LRHGWNLQDCSAAHLDVITVTKPSANFFGSASCADEVTHVTQSRMRRALVRVGTGVMENMVDEV